MKFLRTGGRGAAKKSRLGYSRRNKAVWRRARGRHNKTRENRKGRAIKVQIGFRTNKDIRGKIDGKKPIFVTNIQELEKCKKNDIVIIAKIGKRKRAAIDSKAKELGVTILNPRGKNEFKK